MSSLGKIIVVWWLSKPEREKQNKLNGLQFCCGVMFKISDPNPPPQPNPGDPVPQPDPNNPEPVPVGNQQPQIFHHIFYYLTQ
jgi:hypothetical protein